MSTGPNPGGYVAFEGRIEPLEWGRNTYTILRLPPEILAALGTPRRVEGEIADHPVDMGVARSDVIADAFLYTGKTFLSAAGIEPGEAVVVRLRPGDPDHVEMPEGLAAAIRAAGLTEPWGALTPGKRRGLVHPVASAKRPETRSKRIAALLDGLRRA